MTMTEDDLARQMGHRLRMLRLYRDVTQIDLATAAQISRGTIGNIERGRTVMSVGTLARIADALRVDPGLFFASEVRWLREVERLDRQRFKLRTRMKGRA